MFCDFGEAQATIQPLLNKSRIQFTVNFHFEEVGVFLLVCFQESSENLKAYSYPAKENVLKSFLLNN